MTAPVSVVIAYDDGSRVHDVPGHPETAQRLRAITERLVADPVLRRLPATVVGDADPELMLGVHDETHLLAVDHIARSGGGWIDEDTYCTSRSYDVALRAAGAAVSGVGAVCGGEATAAFALIRPPGHHATRRRAMGFCLFNNAAVAVRAAQRRFGVGRVAIVDIDVHHGNGTQDVFYDDPSVLYSSLHQWPLWPGTGRASETGEGAAAGTTLNVPLAAHTTADGWLAAFDGIVAPALRRFAPELIVVSAGYDAHRADRMAQLELDTATYAEVARRIGGIAAECAGGRSLWVLEGGYDLDALSASVIATLHALAAGEG
ncbi:MAG TPA: histone deacetylase [Acidimicrobiia bacterium]|jgi:acetoin utilization deacetylase AcuC-like enzyme|nr:histone deacetylase [Acidimicrobiia bacterium]